MTALLALSSNSTAGPYAAALELGYSLLPPDTFAVELIKSCAIVGKKRNPPRRGQGGFKVVGTGYGLKKGDQRGTKTQT